MTPETLLSYDIPLFEGLTPADLEARDIRVSVQRFEPWQTVLDTHDGANDLYFLISDRIMALFWTTHGKEIVFSHFRKGSFFGELAALDGAPRSLAMVARTEATVLILKRTSFLELFNEVPLIRSRITQSLIDSVRDLTARTTEMLTMTVDERVGNYLLRLAAGKDMMRKGSVIESAPTHAEIAASVGANREMVSRAISKLNKLGIISSARRQITILDPEGLSNIVT